MSVGIVLLDACKDSRRALATSLDEFSDVTVAATADDEASAMLQTERVAAHVLIVATPLTVSLPEVCEACLALDSEPKVLVLDRLADEETLLHAIEAGVDGYVTGADGVAGLADAVRSIVGGEAVIPPTMLGALLRRLIQRRRDAANAAQRLVDLTRREREVLHLLVGGHNQHGIAAELFISPETARTHVQRVLRKLDVHSRREAVALVAQLELADRLAAMVDRSAS
jgi:DNA-binding NarL/FixJ family response regulator